MYLVYRCGHLLGPGHTCRLRVDANRRAELIFDDQTRRNSATSCSLITQRGDRSTEYVDLVLRAGDVLLFDSIL